jgi:hypothetical protein
MHKIILSTLLLTYSMSLISWNLNVTNNGSSPSYVFIKFDNQSGLKIEYKAVLLPNDSSRWNARRQQEESKGIDVFTKSHDWSLDNSGYADVYVDLPNGGQSHETNLGNGVFSPKDYWVTIEDYGTHSGRK